MAVQAQHPKPSCSFSKSFRPHINVAEELQILQDQQQLQVFLGTDVLQLCNNSKVGVGFSDLQKSELTFNVPRSRKRSRKEPSMELPQLNYNTSSGTDQQCFPLSSQAFCFPNLSLPMTNCAPLSGAVHQPLDSRLLESSGTSTSGRPVLASCHGLVAQLYQQNTKIDDLVRFQTQSLRSGLDLAIKRHCRTLLSVLEAQVAKRLKEKEMELEDVHRRNAELEEKIRRIAEEKHVWFNVAKKNEAIACSLRSSIEQVLQNSIAAGNCLDPTTEGYGDSGDAPFPADEEHSWCPGNDVYGSGPPADGARRRNACIACGQQDVCVLLLPCRHLCLCKDCESKVGACPVCHCAMKASLQVYISS